jgi:hypothetical protein
VLVRHRAASLPAASKQCDSSAEHLTAVLPRATGIHAAVIPHQGKTRHRSGGLYSRAVSYAAFFPALSFAHLARCAAAILFLPAAEIVRFTIVKPVVFAKTAAGCDPFRAFAHRFFCARLMRLRASADRVRPPSECELPKAASAALNRWTSCFALFSSFFKCPTTPDKFPIGSPSTQNCN